MTHMGNVYNTMYDLYRVHFYESGTDALRIVDTSFVY